MVSDPQNHIFVIKNSGFVAYAIEGTYDVLSIVDQTHLPGIVKDRLTGVTLGSFVLAPAYPDAQADCSSLRQDSRSQDDE